MNRLVGQLDRNRGLNRLFLVGYLPAGYPTAPLFTECVRAAFSSGVDAMEISLPNPPVTRDGELIQEATRIGAAQVGDPREALRRAAEGRADDTQSIIAMVYRHAFEALGTAGLVDACVDADVDAILLPEHTMAEQLELVAPVRAAGLETVLFLHREKDVRALADAGVERPVIYLQSADLRTGDSFDPATARCRLETVRSIFGAAEASILVGFGIRGRDEIAALAPTSADGAIVGTALVAEAADGPAAVSRLVTEIRAWLPRPVAGVSGGD